MEMGPKVVGARSSLMTLPSSSQRFGVAKNKRSVSGLPSSFVSQSCTKQQRRVERKCELAALLGGQYINRPPSSTGVSAQPSPQMKVLRVKPWASAP